MILLGSNTFRRPISLNTSHGRGRFESSQKTRSSGEMTISPARTGRPAWALKIFSEMVCPTGLPTIA